MSIAKVWAKAVRKQSKFYFAHWQPTTALALGTVGTLEDKYFFIPDRPISALGYDFDPTNPDHVTADQASGPFKVKYAQTRTTKIAGEANAELPNVPVESAGIKLEFSSKGGFVAEAQKATHPRIRDRSALEQWIKEQYKAGKWQKDWAVVYSVVLADSASVLISESKNSSIELAVTGAVKPSVAKLGDASVELTSVSEKGTTWDFPNERNVTPMFRLVGLKRKYPIIGPHDPAVLSTAVPIGGPSDEDLDDLFAGDLGGDDID